MFVFRKLQRAAWDDPDTLSLVKQFMECAAPSSLTLTPSSAGAQPHYVAPPRPESNASRRRRRFDNGTMSNKRLKPTQETLQARVSVAGPVLCAATLNILHVRGLLPDHTAAYIGYGDDDKLQKLVDEHFADRPLVIGVDYEWRPNYDPSDHPVHVSGPYMCYGVDVGVYTTGKFTLVVHHCQFNESKWAPPGPYIAKRGKKPEQHFNLKKWKFPKCLLDLMNDQQVSE